MKNILISIAAVLAGLTVSVIDANAQNIKEGKWSMTITTEMQGMDAEMAQAMEAMKNMPPEQKAMMQKMMGGMGTSLSEDGQGMTITMTQCISQTNPVPQTEKQKNCKETHSIKGNMVSFETICPDGTSSGQVTYEGDSMKGTVTTNQTGEGQEIEATVDIEGKYIGPCDE